MALKAEANRASSNGPSTGTVRKLKFPAKPSTVAVSDPQAPFANESGLVAAPNVDLAQEMISQLVAKYSFAANARVMKADDDMAKSLLDMRA